MKLSTIFLLFLTFNGLNSNASLRCFFYFEKYFAIYNVKDMIQPVKEPKEFNYVYKGQGEPISGKIKVNICEYVELPESCSTVKNQSSVLFISDDSKTCISLLKSSTERSSKNYEILDKDHVLEGFKI